MNEESALRMLEKEPYDIILAECRSPHSETLCAKLLERFSGKTILLCENTPSHEMEERLESSHISYLCKPFSLSELETILKRLLPEKR
jgi:DNA-binding response OmpR family regulator